MISNPVKVWGKGKELEFTYEGGSKAYHFSPYDNELSLNMANNVIFFANDKDHAKEVLEKMFNFIIRESREVNNDRIADRFEVYLSNIDHIEIKEAPMNQFYIVGWAANDTLH